MSEHILAHLSRADTVLGNLIRAVGPCRLAPEADCQPFRALAQAIAHQQLHRTAANSILARLVDSCGQGVFPTPQMVLAASAASLRAVGFSFAKVAALRDLAEKTLAQVVPDAATLRALTDSQSTVLPVTVVVQLDVPAVRVSEEPTVGATASTSGATVCEARESASAMVKVDAEPNPSRMPELDVVLPGVTVSRFVPSAEISDVT